MAELTRGEIPFFILGHAKRPEEKYFEQAQWVPLLNSELDPFPDEREKEWVSIHRETLGSNFSFFMEVCGMRVGGPFSSYWFLCFWFSRPWI